MNILITISLLFNLIQHLKYVFGAADIFPSIMRETGAVSVSSTPYKSTSANTKFYKTYVMSRVLEILDVD